MNGNDGPGSDGSGNDAIPKWASEYAISAVILYSEHCCLSLGATVIFAIFRKRSHSPTVLIR
jgi:hypothetical protein